MVLFLGLIARKLMDGDSNKNRQHLPAAYPVPVGVPMSCNCRGDRYCPQCSQHPHPHQPVAMMPMMSPHDAKREWKYERRAMRDARRAARRGYGYAYGYPAAGVPVAVPPMGGGPARNYYDGYDDDYRAAGPSSRARPENRPAAYREGAGSGAPADSPKGLRRREGGNGRRSSLDEEYLEEEQDADLPPKYEPGNWVPRPRSVDGSTQGKQRY